MELRQNVFEKCCNNELNWSISCSLYCAKTTCSAGERKPPSFTENRNALSLKLLSAAAKAEISGGTHDTFVSTWSLTASILCAVASVIVEEPHCLAILSGLALSSVDGNLSVAVRIRALGANLRAGFQIGGVPYHHHVSAATASSCSGAASAGCCCCHVKGLPRQVECRILIKAGRKQVLRQTAVLVELCKSIWLASVGQLSFKFGNLKMWNIILSKLTSLQGLF